jgi:hypothetical protein
MAICLAAFPFAASMDGLAQLASTNENGFKVDVTGIWQSGSSLDLDGTIQFRFSGGKANRAFGMSPIHIVEAVDDTGLNLVRTNQHFSGLANLSIVPASQGGFWQTVGGADGALKAPASAARTIRHLEGETSFYLISSNTPTVAHFMAEPGQVMHQAALDANGIRIIYRPDIPHFPPGSLVIDSSAGKTISLAVDDPNHRIVKLAIQRPDGRLFPNIGQSTSATGTHVDYSFHLAEKPPDDLTLVIYLDDPAGSLHFSLDNIRLPWVDSPDFEASAQVDYTRRARGTDPFICNLTLSFSGGPLTNAWGIHRLWINQAEDDSGKEVDVGNFKHGGGQWRWPFDTVSDGGEGRMVRKFVPMVFESPNPRIIRILKGEAELVRWDVTNSPVVIAGFQNQREIPMDLPVLKAQHVVLGFLGAVNYAAKLREAMSSTNGVSQNGRLPPSELPGTEVNALEFSLDDPDNVVLDGLHFIAPGGRELLATAVMVSGNTHIYRFENLPPVNAQLMLNLEADKSLQRVPFEIRDISVTSWHPWTG